MSTLRQICRKESMVPMDSQSSFHQTEDSVFRVLEESISVPEPTTLALLTLGLARTRIRKAPVITSSLLEFPLLVGTHCLNGCFKPSESGYRAR